MMIPLTTFPLMMFSLNPNNDVSPNNISPNDVSPNNSSSNDVFP
jgi:hypothetical protein